MEEDGVRVGESIYVSPKGERFVVSVVTTGRTRTRIRF